MVANEAGGAQPPPMTAERLEKIERWFNDPGVVRATKRSPMTEDTSKTISELAAEIRRLRAALSLAGEALTDNLPAMQGHVRLAAEILGVDHAVTQEASRALRHTQDAIAAIRQVQP